MTYDFNLDNDIDIKPIAKSGHILTNGAKTTRSMQISGKRGLYYMENPKEDTGTRKDLCLYRIQTAKENLNAARILLAAGEYKSSTTAPIMLFSMPSMLYMH